MPYAIVMLYVPCRGRKSVWDTRYAYSGGNVVVVDVSVVEVSVMEVRVDEVAVVVDVVVDKSTALESEARRSAYVGVATKAENTATLADVS